MQPSDQVELDFNEPPSERNHPYFDMIESKIVAAAWSFHESHPQVFDIFLKFAKEAKAAGRTRFGAAMIIQRIRWYVQIEKLGTLGEKFKINDHMGAFYSRLLMIRFQEFEGMFELRSSQETEN